MKNNCLQPKCTDQSKGRVCEICCYDLNDLWAVANAVELSCVLQKCGQCLAITLLRILKHYLAVRSIL